VDGWIISTWAAITSVCSLGCGVGVVFFSILKYKITQRDLQNAIRPLTAGGFIALLSLAV
jgi:hypothetical protein